MLNVLAALDSNGVPKNLRVDGSDQLKVAVSGAGSGGTSAVDGDTGTAGVMSGTPLMGVYESSPTAVADGKLGVAGITPARRLKVDSATASAAVGTVTRVAALASSQTALASNASRIGVVYTNDSDKICWLKYGAVASTTSYTKKLLPGQDWEPPVLYTGRVDVLFDTGPTGALEVTEL